MERFRLTILVESRIRWKVYVRFGGEYWETYHRNMTRRRVLSLPYVADLLDAGVELYRYDNGFLHAKLVIVDDTLASVGTANMDYRSLTDNLEVTAFIRDRETVRQLAATFDDDLASCRRITRAEWRPPLWRRTLGDVLRLVSPLM